MVMGRLLGCQDDRNWGLHLVHRLIIVAQRVIPRDSVSVRPMSGFPVEVQGIECTFCDHKRHL